MNQNNNDQLLLLNLKFLHYFLNKIFNLKKIYSDVLEIKKLKKYLKIKISQIIIILFGKFSFTSLARFDFSKPNYISTTNEFKYI